VLKNAKLAQPKIIQKYQQQLIADTIQKMNFHATSCEYIEVTANAKRPKSLKEIWKLRKS